MRGTNTGTDGVVKPGTFGENPNGRVVFLSNGQYERQERQERKERKARRERQERVEGHARVQSVNV